MKVVSAFFKFIAIVLMIFFVVSIPIMLFSRKIGQSLYDPSGLIDIIQENVLDADTLARIAEEAGTEAETFGEGDEENPFAELIQIGINNLSHEDWVKIINLILPPEILSQALDQIVDGYYQWLDGRNSAPLIRIDLIPWKNNILTNAIPIFDLVMKNFPPCNPDQINDYQYIRYSGDFTQVPQCRPPEPLYSHILDAGATEMPEYVDSFPDYVDNSTQLREVGRDWQELRQNLMGLIDLMRSGWIFIIFLFIIAVPMGARSFHGLFTWAGWPLLLAGIWGLLIALSFLFFTESIFIALGVRIPAEIPRPLFPSMRVVIFAFIHYFARPLLIQSAVMIGLGGMAVLGGVIIKNLREPQTLPSSDYPSTILGGEEQMETVKKPSPDPQPKAKKPDREDDDDSPTGMFG